MRLSRLISAFLIASFAAVTAPSLAQEPADPETANPAEAAEGAPSEALSDEALSPVWAQENSNIGVQASSTSGVGPLESEDTTADSVEPAEPL